MVKPKDTQLYFDTMKIRLAGIKDTSIVDGQGVRYVIFTQGCSHCCPDCHNKHTWNKDGGYDESINTILDAIRNLPKWYNGITLSGGEPFDQEEACTFVAKKARDYGLSVWTYTGYTFEQLVERKDRSLLEATDVLVDGPYIQAMRTDIPFIGSYNQRVINLHAVRSLSNGSLQDFDTTKHELSEYAHFTFEQGLVRKNFNTHSFDHLVREESYTHV